MSTTDYIFSENFGDELSAWSEDAGADVVWNGIHQDEWREKARTIAAMTVPSNEMLKRFCAHRDSGRPWHVFVSEWLCDVDWVLSEVTRRHRSPTSELGQACVMGWFSNDDSWVTQDLFLTNTLYATGLISLDYQPTPIYRALGGQALLEDSDPAKAANASAAAFATAQSVSKAPMVACHHPMLHWEETLRTERERLRSAFAMRIAAKNDRFDPQLWFEALASIPTQDGTWRPDEFAGGAPSLSLTIHGLRGEARRNYATAYDSNSPTHGGVYGWILAQAQNRPWPVARDLLQRTGFRDRWLTPNRWDQYGTGWLRDVQGWMPPKPEMGRAMGWVERWGCLPRSPRFRVPWSIAAPPCCRFGSAGRRLTLTSRRSWADVLRGLAPGRAPLGALEHGWRGAGGVPVDVATLSDAALAWLAEGRVGAWEGWGCVGGNKVRRERIRPLTLSTSRGAVTYNRLSSLGDTRLRRRRRPRRREPPGLHVLIDDGADLALDAVSRDAAAALAAEHRAWQRELWERARRQHVGRLLRMGARRSRLMPPEVIAATAAELGDLAS